ncbi:hypothetical protein FQN57_001630 [Myotisia sp. PD_48]|nr:hypothetical protein FQN57_001630 [Myotisia sp. PD_48]
MRTLSAGMGLTIDPQILQKLPYEISQILIHPADTQYNQLIEAALNPRFTSKLFSLFEPVFVDIVARWLSLDPKNHFGRVICALSRVLPLCPYMRPFAIKVLETEDLQLPLYSRSHGFDLLKLENDSILQLLLSAFRLLSFDVETFSAFICLQQLQALLSHPNEIIRCLAVRSFCLYMRAADASTEKMLRRHCGTDLLEGEWEDQKIDYRLISFLEEQRCKALETELLTARMSRDDTHFERWIKDFKSSLYAADIGGVLVPTISEMGEARSSGAFKFSGLVQTQTVRSNLRKVGQALLSPDPILLVGLPGSGKTSLVMEAAHRTGHIGSMITLHLNEQTDSKSLLGVYTSSPQSGTFKWQPGVLTQAAKEGRWILIEDLDRAPAEVLALILPLVENRQLVIPSRQEYIHCAEGFRILATMRSSLNNKGDEIIPGNTMLGARIWNTIQVSSLPVMEIAEIINQEFPLLALTRYSELFLNLYSRILSTLHGSIMSRAAQGRQIGFRDLMKFCQRVEKRLQSLGIQPGKELVPEYIDIDIFLDAVDCFATHLPNNDLLVSLASVVAEELRISPQQMKFCLNERIPAYSDEPSNLVIGRETYRKTGVRKGSRSRFKNSFAATKSSLKVMEQAAAALQLSEPLLLVGETGIGKTAVVQQLASLLNQRLTVVNLSQQSEATDLLGGYKPVNIRSIAIPLVDEFHSLFESTFSVIKNQKFLTSVAKCVSSGNWSRLVVVLNEAVKMSSNLFRTVDKPQSEHDGSAEQPTKKRKIDRSKYSGLAIRWDHFAGDLKEFELRVSQGDTKFSFAFVQGKIVKALKNGEWVLLDEINLASPDTLESIASLLHYGRDGSPSVLLSEAGEIERIVGHPDFRIFGAMNPATDAGKRDLAPSLRSRFTELYVRSPDNDLDDLLSLIMIYLGPLVNRDPRAASDLATLYLETKKLNIENRLTDGAGQKPHFSIRTLVRALMYVTDQAHVYGLRRALYEGFCMSFLTLLSKSSDSLIIPLLDKHIFGNLANSRSVLSQTPRQVDDGLAHVQYKHYWIRKGDFPPEEQAHYIITPFIERNLMNLVRASSTRRFPVLLQGPTSSGKTSMVEHLAKISGNRFVRINNHEHTDLQEYLGSYVASEDGGLRYQEGILVEALKKGFWIVLDELNLAPTDVLEAMNRLLDDNRELFVPETQEVVRPHPNFMLFATQNPAGLYGGRKVLSRAFRNRFLELHFDDIPEDELEFILKERSQIPPSFCSRIVSVYKQLSILRQSNRLFEQRNSFATLRDLFRWAMRRADDREQLAMHGFMLLAERVRNQQERDAVKKVIESVMKVKLDEKEIYGVSRLEARLNHLSAPVPKNVVWTPAMRRLFILVSEAIEHNEPVLLVGETGCGKTQLCQAIATAYGKELFSINAHVNLETGDLIGAQRPIRNRSLILQQLGEDISSIINQEWRDNEQIFNSLDDLKQAFYGLDPSVTSKYDPLLIQRIQENLKRANSLFEWFDGGLVTAMKTGQHFLLDELSLAEDSVLERLNSVLEPSRTILLAEKGPIDSLVTASEGFQFLGTMNPGGDYGKRELSAALRNRLTEIWVADLQDDEDILPILESKIRSPLKDASTGMVHFAKWFKQRFQGTAHASISVRDLLAWVEFVNSCDQIDPVSSIVHGACLVYIDALGANPSALLASTSGDLEKDKLRALKKLGSLFSIDAVSIYQRKVTLQYEPNSLNIGLFSLPLGPNSTKDSKFAFDAPTTLSNTLRVARGLQSSKPILLEGSPGVGKTTLVAALADTLGIPLTRINLSEQTDLTDLFGSDIPVEGADMGSFAWSDAPFLRAMQQGGWVLLDEMNLASQSVLEGLNSCLDHRHQVYIAELGQTFQRHPDFFLFATQNPHHQGGGRKGLPASFVNRFTVVYADSFTSHDLELICKRLSPTCPEVRVDNLVKFVTSLNVKLLGDRQLGILGAPWEVNLRDLSRWLTLLESIPAHVSPSQFLDVVIRHRFRTIADRAAISKLYSDTFGTAPDTKSYFHNLTPNKLQVGLASLERDPILYHTLISDYRSIPRNLPIMESILFSIKNAWPCLLVGPSGCGKTRAIRKLASLSGARLVELALNSDTDAMDLIGGFEQRDEHRHVSAFMNRSATLLQQLIVQECSKSTPTPLRLEIIKLYSMIKHELPQPQIMLETLKKLAQDTEITAFNKLYEQYQAIYAENNPKTVGFEWTEGVLIHAMRQGDWVVLDNANLCNATVLDRLNSLMEPRGCLIINERKSSDGSAQIVTPHPNFRLFLTMDPRHGELSRAMRNRSVEIFFLPQEEMRSVTPSRANYLAESAIYRIREYQHIVQNHSSTATKVQVFEGAVQHLSARDIFWVQDFIRTFPQSWGILDSSLQIILAQYYSLLSSNVLAGRFQQPHRQGTIVDASLDSLENVEPIHPLVNEPQILFSIEAQSHPAHFRQAAKLQELQFRTAQFQYLLAQVDSAAKEKKSAEMNRLERSVTSKLIPAHAKDSTQPVARFLYESCHHLSTFFNIASYPISEDTLNFAEAILLFCWDLFNLTQCQKLDNAVFLTYLNIGNAIHGRFEYLASDLHKQFTDNLGVFRANWGLSTGQSMQRMWNRWRPATPANSFQYEQMIRFQQLCSKFDQLALGSRVPLDELCYIHDSLVKVQLSLLQGADISNLIPVSYTKLKVVLQSLTNSQEFNVTINRLESRATAGESFGVPYFSREFEALCQYNDLDNEITNAQVGLPTAVKLLAGRPSRPTEISSADSPVPGILSRLSRFGGFQNCSYEPLALLGNVCVSLLDKFTRVGQVPLGQINLLEAEIASLSKGLSSEACQISTNQASPMLHQLIELFKELVGCHESMIEKESYSNALRFLQIAPSNDGNSVGIVPDIEIQRVVEGGDSFGYFQGNGILTLISTVAAHREKPSAAFELGQLCIKLSMGLLRSYIPNKPFDPSLNLAVEHQRYTERWQEKNKELTSLKICEVLFSGQNSSLRIQKAEEELLRLGNEPPKSPVARPQQSRLDVVQAQFMNVLHSVLNQSPEQIISTSCTRSDDTMKHDHSTDRLPTLLQQNVRQICRRLSESCPEYDDVTILAIRFLQLLDQGITLVKNGHFYSDPAASLLKGICQSTPFLGSSLPNLSLPIVTDPKTNPRMKMEAGIHALSIVGAFQNIDQTTFAEGSYRDLLQETLHQAYVLWKEKLDLDQSNEIEKAKFYQYRGSFDDDQEASAEEMLHLFPTFDDESDITDHTVDLGLQTGDLGRKFYAAFNDLFLSEESETRLMRVIKQASRFIGSLGTKSGNQLSLIEPKYHLAAVFLQMDDINTAQPTSLYNFYADPNLEQVKGFADLVRKVQIRFIQLQESWPEHATLAEVVNYCSKIFGIPHQEPLAKFLTMAEKLHGFVHEWQTVASKEFSAADHYDNLTSTLIGWRRLELTTWSRLLDLEDEKCRQATAAWWFIAYEVIILAPAQLAREGMELGNHIADLVSTLEKFICTTPMGQLSCRIDILRKFHKLLDLYVIEYPALRNVSTALQNLINHYSPFLPVIGKLLSDKRQALATKIKEQIQLASWKDTNITALRESARRSHHSLFKLIRKYREILAKPCEEFLLGEIPDAELDSQPVPNTQILNSGSVSVAAIDACRKLGALWGQRPPRFQNPDSTARNMHKVYTSALPEIQVVAQLEEFMADVTSSIADFKKRTPKVYNEENKDEIQHLKIQKHRFYAERLKDLRFMGLRSNLGTDLLSKQSSIASVLATAPGFSSDTFPFVTRANRYLHRFLHIIPGAREIARNYSEDLSSVEAARSAGFMEGFLYQIMRQRETLSPALVALVSLDTAVKSSIMAGSSQFGAMKSDSGASTHQKEIHRTLKWLAPVIGLSITVLGIHQKYSTVESSPIIALLGNWKKNVVDLQRRFASLPRLPSGLQSQMHQDLVEEAKIFVASIRSQVLAHTQVHPESAFALHQLLLWTMPHSTIDLTVMSAAEEGVSINDLDSALLTTMDKMLVALQRVGSLLSTAPTTIEDATWLTKTDHLLSKSLSELHMDEIATSINSVLDSFQNFRDTGCLDAARSLISITLPILEQYQQVCADLVKQYASLHSSFCKFGFVLTKSFKQIASEGFCSPPEPSNEQGKGDKVESGTGLGEGEGAEDISKDVQDDEDLSDLAQQPDEGTNDIEESKDAVDMDRDEMEGKEGESSTEKEKDEGDESESDEKDELDEEVGSVDGLDDSAVDEKMWDGESEENQKDTENDEGKGAENSEDTTAAPEQKQEKSHETETKKDGENKDGDEGDEGDEEEEAPDDEHEAIGREDMDVTDPHAEENEVLDLPDDIGLDGQEKEEDLNLDDNMSDISMDDVDQPEEGAEEMVDQKEDQALESDTNMDETGDAAEDDAQKAQEDDQWEEEEEQEVGNEEDKNDIMETEADEQVAALDNTVPSEQVSVGAEQEQGDDKGTSGNALTDQPVDQMNNEGEDGGAKDPGQDGKQSNLEAGDGANDDQRDPQLQGFRKLGDILEQWHRTQREIQESSEQPKEPTEEQELGGQDVDFEHLADNDEAPDTQALGQAMDEKPQAMNQSQAIESDSNAQDDEYLPDSEDLQDANSGNNLEDLMELDGVPPSTNGKPTTSVPRTNDEKEIGTGDSGAQSQDNHELDDMDAQLSVINLSSEAAPLTPPDEARRLWTHYESITHDLSLSLTEQLRLILAPTLATKLRGDFRTGKRLNIKRIIPYIASQFKRDKIWMRRSVPSKRNYQIMIAVDDSKSMLESASGQLAFQTLALVSRSLSMLESGDLCIVGFGNEEHIRVAHEFGKPFSSEAGSQVFQHFSYKQTGTNVRQLLADSVALFREARAKRPSSSASGDLWQLQLIISDGICEDHDGIARLVRQAQEERIMIVFIIVDAVQEESRSIMNLTQATFESDGPGTGEGRWKMKKYIDGFPFPYYLIVRNVQELPGVLSLALKQWFAEVVEISA